MISANRFGLGSVLLFGLLGLTSGYPAFSALPVELVQSVPIETNLAVQGIRSTQQVWIQMINGAKHSIDLEQFYINNKPGEALDPVLAALRAAAARGVQIRFVLDVKFYKTYPNDPNRLSSVPNILLKTIDFSSLGGIQHSKYIVVDGQEAYIGSANFDWLALKHIHEVGLHFIDTGIGDGLEEIFVRDWARGTPIHGSTSSSSLASKNSYFRPSETIRALFGFQLVASPVRDVPNGIPNTLPALVSGISSAQRSVKVQVYDYSTSLFNNHSASWRVLDDALRNAASRGVHVQLLFDKAAMKVSGQEITALSKVRNVEVRLVTIPQWSGGPLAYARLVHSKYMLIDDRAAWIGTENWTGDYFISSRNVGLVFKEPQTVSGLSRIFNQVWNSPYISAP